MTVVTPSAIQSFIDATNAEDTDTFVAAFADDATLDDWGRVFTGREGIARWNETDNIGTHSRFDVVEVAEGAAAGEFVVTVEVTGDGFTGLGTMTFRVTHGLVESLTIS